MNHSSLELYVKLIHCDAFDAADETVACCYVRWFARFHTETRKARKNMSEEPPT
jgi:hypothetical protein